MTLWHILRAPTCRKLHMKSGQFVPLCCEDLLQRSKYHIYLSHTHRELFELLLFQFVRVYQLLCLVSFFFSSWNRSVVESCSSYGKASFSDWGCYEYYGEIAPALSPGGDAPFVAYWSHCNHYKDTEYQPFSFQFGS